MQLHIYKDPAELSQQLAEWITQTIETSLQQQNRFTFVLTGGSSPKLLYELLASPPYKERIDWTRLHIFWGDERAVPFTDDRNNAKMTYELLLSKVPVIPNQVYKMDTSIEANESAVAYEKILQEYFTETGNTFDLVLNGMGDDGHTLSLFPHTKVIHEKRAWVSAYYLEPQQMFRITLTPPVVNRAKKIVFIAYGAGKANALTGVLQGARNVDQYPSQIIQPVKGELHWFVDKAATAHLVTR